jgi:hypothetical protein
MIIFFYVINCGIALQMVTSILGNCKTIFNERYEMSVERDCFKDILDSFNEGILIVSDDPPVDSNPLPEEKRETTQHQERKVHFVNREVKRVFGDSMENVMH